MPPAPDPITGEAGTPPRRVDTFTIVLLIALGIAPIVGVLWYMRPIDWPFDAAQARRRQAGAAKRLGVEPTQTVTAAGASFELVLVPPGQFMMGSPRGEPHREGKEELRRETIGDAFYMSATEVTRGQFSAFASATSYKTDAERTGYAHVNSGPEKGWEKRAGASWREPGFEQTDDHPVVCVTLKDAGEFCRWLSAELGRTVRVPSGPEWEYACRAGAEAAYHWGDDYREASAYCNLSGAEAAAHWPDWDQCADWDDGFVFTAPVRSFQPNAWGLYDMAGNAEESTANGPCRGGSWNVDPWWYCRSAHRSNPANGYSSEGFRIVVEIE